MKVNVEFSIFSSPTKAYGNVTGTLEIQHLPDIGDRLTFVFQNEEKSVADTGFDGILKVDARRFDLGRDIQCTLSLDGIVADGAEKARILMDYFENEFGFFVYGYD